MRTPYVIERWARAADGAPTCVTVLGPHDGLQSTFDAVRGLTPSDRARGLAYRVVGLSNGAPYVFQAEWPEGFPALPLTFPPQTVQLLSPEVSSS